MTLKSRSRVTQGHWKRNHWIDHTRLTISRVIWRLILLWPWNVGWRSLKIIESGTIWKLGYGFIFAFHSNYGRIFSHFGDIQRRRMVWPWNLGLGYSGSLKMAIGSRSLKTVKACHIGSPDWWVYCFKTDVSGCTWAMTPVVGDPKVTAFLKALSLHWFCSTCTPTTCQLHVAENSFTLTTYYVLPFKANTSANWNAVSRQIWRGCHTSVDSGDLNRAPPKQSVVCSTCIIPALRVNCQLIWMACAFGMSATQPILWWL